MLETTVRDGGDIGVGTGVSRAGVPEPSVSSAPRDRRTVSSGFGVSKSRPPDEEFWILIERRFGRPSCKSKGLGLGVDKSGVWL